MAVTKPVVWAAAGIIGFASCVGVKELLESRDNEVKKIASLHNISVGLAREYYSAGVPTFYLESKGGLEKLMANGGTPEVMKRIVDRNRGGDTRRNELTTYDLSLLENPDNDPRKKAENYQMWMESGYSLASAETYLTYDFNLNEAAKLQSMNIFPVDVFELASRSIPKELVYGGFTHGLTKDEISYLAGREFDKTKTYTQLALAELVSLGWRPEEIKIASEKTKYDFVKGMIRKGMKKEAILRNIIGK
ncbi:MAG: hypothetical protein AABW63_01985 [Nanoarchaeota archaeon]